MKTYVLAATADRDLDDIWHSTATRAGGAQVADRLEAGLHRTMMRRAGSPGMGHARDDLANERLRVFPKGKYLIVYLPGTDPLPIVRVLHSARDIAALFSAVT